MMYRLTTCLAVAALLLPAALRAQGLPSYNDVLLMVNDSSRNSVEIAQFFAQRRNIPANHIFHFTIDTARQASAAGETIDSLTFYRRVFWPLEAFMRAGNLVDSINYIVTTKGCPLRVSPSYQTGYFSSLSSFTDCIAFANSRDSAYLLTNKPSPLGSPYFGSTQHFKHSQASMQYYLVTRLDAYTVDQVKAYIQKAENPSYCGQGLFVLDVAPGRDADPGYKVGNDWLRNAAAILLDKGLNVFLDTTTVYVTKQNNVMGYASWGSNDANSSQYATHAIPGNTYVNGSIGETFVSTGGRSFTTGTSYGQSLVADWVAEGISGIKGYTDEPYLSVMAEPDMLFDRWTGTMNLAEAYWSSSPWVQWRQVVIGDPKMQLKRPFAWSDSTVDCGTHERYTPGSPVSVYLRNKTTGTVTINKPLFGGGDSSSFAIGGGTTFPTTVRAGDSLRLQITCTPRQIGLAGATVRVPCVLASNLGRKFEDIAVSGSGTYPLMATQDTITFDDTRVGDSVHATLTIGNGGKGDTVRVTTLTVSKTVDFHLDDASPTTGDPAIVLPNNAPPATFTVTFAPSDTGMRSTTLAIRSNATNPIRPKQVTLRGRATGTSGIRERAAPGALVIESYPDPAIAIATVHASGIPAGARIELVDMLGRRVADLSPMFAATGGTATIAVSSLPQGVYVVRATAGTQIVEHRLVVMR